MMLIFAVRDVKSESYLSLITLATKGLALRGFAEACSDARSPLAQYPSDFMLYELGTYDPSSGRIEAYKVPVWVASASDVVEQLKLAQLVAPKSVDVKEAVQ